MQRVWIAAALAASACTWVPLSEGGGEVHLGTPATVIACEKLGATSANTRARAGIFARSRKTVEQELESLARNEAADIGGDTVVPRGPVTNDGRRVFDVYRCGV